MDPNKEAELLKNKHLTRHEIEQRRNERFYMTHRMPNTSAGDLFTFRSNRLPFSSENVPQPLHTPSYNVSSSYSANNSRHIDSLNLEEATRSPDCNITYNGPSTSVSNQSDCESEVKASEMLCSDRSCNSAVVASTSGCNKVTVNDSAASVNLVKSRKRPSSLKLNKYESEANDSSSDTGNDNYSLGSEDGCIYTYRGGEHLADLPSSFFSLDMGLPKDNHLPMPPQYPLRAENQPANRESRASSPDMDFLEMDFDPGPSCDAETGDESSAEQNLDMDNQTLDEAEPIGDCIVAPVVSPAVVDTHANMSSSLSLHNCNGQSMPSTSRALSEERLNTNNDNISYGRFITQLHMGGDRVPCRRSMPSRPDPLNHHSSCHDMVSLLQDEKDEADALELYFLHVSHKGEDNHSLRYHLANAKKELEMKNKASAAKAAALKLAAEASTIKSENEVEIPTCIIWTEKEAYDRQNTQLDTAASVVANVFVALGVPADGVKIIKAFGPRPIANDAPLPRYLLLRSIIDSTAADLMKAINQASGSEITARFFPTYPERAFSLSHWLAEWISIGAVPILTLNPQVGCVGPMPESWHHRMVCGVSPLGVSLCGPVERVPQQVLHPRLSSPSTMLVRVCDVMSRFHPHTDLTPLMHVPDPRYHTCNVLGQVVNVLREWRAANYVEGAMRTQYIKLPVAYQAGITVAARTGSEAHQRLMAACPLPLLSPQTQTLQM